MTIIAEPSLFFAPYDFIFVTPLIRPLIRWLQPAENNAPFVHHCFGGTLPLREKRSGY